MLAADPRKLRYDAACSTVLASAGQGEDAKNLPDKVQLMLRRQALTWLRADLAAWSQFLDNAEPQARATVERTLQHWQSNPDLAAVRDKSGWQSCPTRSGRPGKNSGPTLKPCENRRAKANRRGPHTFPKRSPPEQRP
jgi:hypothetical protein